MQLLCQIFLLGGATVVFLSRLATVEPLYDPDYKLVVDPGAITGICVEYILFIMALYFAGALSEIA
jgi:hypothetical protein